MSVVFVAVPVLVAGWPFICGAIAGAAAVMGYKVLKTGEKIECIEDSAWIEIPIEGSHLIAESMSNEQEFVISNGEVTAQFYRTVTGECAMHISGKNKTDEELKVIGEEIIGRVTQNYAYNKVMTEMKNQGFNVTNETVEQDQTIRITVSKFV